MSTADDTLILLEDAISNIDYPGSDSPMWEHKAKEHARTLAAMVPKAVDAEVREEWFVLGHPGWPMGMDFRTQAEAERFFWENPKLDGTRNGMRVMHRTITRYPEYVPSSTGEEQR